MSLIQGTFEFAPVSTLTSTSTADDVNTFLAPCVATFCTQSGLEIKRTVAVDTTYGNAYYLGKPNSDRELCVISMSRASNYYYRRLCICRINDAEGTFYTPIAGALSVDVRYIAKDISFSPFIIYFTKSNDEFFFSENANTYTRYMISSYVYAGITYPILLCFHTNDSNNKLGWSYIPETTIQTIDYYGYGNIDYLTNDTTDILLDVYIGNNIQIKNLKQFSNKLSLSNGSIFSVGTKNYVLLLQNITGLSNISLGCTYVLQYE